MSVETGQAVPLVAIVMGSDSDLRVMQAAADTLEAFGVAHTTRVVSAHRTPHDMLRFGSDAAANGVKVIIAGAGGAAHLPGMLASVTSLPVIGVPVNATALDGMDALLSIAQMPKGVPVATMAIDGAANAALMAIRILAVSDDRLRGLLDEHRGELAAHAQAADARLAER